MPKPTLIQRAFNQPTQVYADGPTSPTLFADPSLPYSQSYNLAQSSGMSRAPSIRSVASSRAPSESGRSRRSVTFDDGASDAGQSIRSFTSSIASRDTTASKRSAFRLSPSKERKGTGGMDIGPSLRSGQQTGLLLSGGSMRVSKNAKTSRRYSSAENLAALRVKEAAQHQQQELTLPPPPMSRAEEAYAASQKRIAALASVGEQPSSPSKSTGMRPSGSSDTIRASPESSPTRVRRTASLSTPVPRKKKTAEEIVAALEKAGLLDRVMEVLPEEEDEATTPTPAERPAWLDSSHATHQPVPEPAPAPTQSSQPVVHQPVVAQSSPPVAPAPRAAVQPSAEQETPQIPVSSPSTPSRTYTLSDFATSPMAAPRAVSEKPVTSSVASQAPAATLPVDGGPSQPAQDASKLAGKPAEPPKAAMKEAAEPPKVVQDPTSTSTLRATPPLTQPSYASSPSISPGLMAVSRPTPVSLLQGERPEPTEAVPLILTELSFERTSSGINVTGKMRGLRPPFKALLRWTTNGWTSYTDVEVDVQGEQSFRIDMFVPPLAGRFELAVRLRDVTGREIWDSNSGRNYSSAFDVAPAASLNVSPSLAATHRSGSPLPPAVGLATPLYTSAAFTPTVAAQVPVNQRAVISPSPPPSLLGSDHSVSPAPSTAVTTPPDSVDGRHLPVIKPVPLKAPAVTSAPIAAIPPRMTLTRTDSDDKKTVELPMPATPPAPIAHRVSFALDEKDDEPERSSPPVPMRSAARRPSAPSSPAPTGPSWAPNSKTLSGPETMSGLAKTKTPKAAVSAPAAVSQPPRTLSETLPKARSVAQTLSNDPSTALADSLPKAPPRGTLASVQQDLVAPLRAPSPVLSEPSVYSRASMAREKPAEANGVPPRGPSPAMMDNGAYEPARSGSISGASFSNEPFVAKRSRLAHLDATLDSQGPYHSRNNSSTPSQTSLVPVADSPEVLSESPASDRMPSRRYALPESGPPFRSTMSAFDLPRGGVPKAPRSVFSDSGRSDVARSVMTVPSGAYRPSRNPAKVGYLSESLANSSATMCAVAIVSNAATSLSRSRFSLFGSKGRPGTASHVPSSRSGGNTRVDFTEIASAPKKLGAGDVLIQVYAVGIDLWDKARVDTLVERGDGYGYIPGRSLCGKAVECGVDVTRIRKGDFVYGLQDLRKSGALADLCVINRDYLALAPQGTLTVEQIASLPCTGVSAFQAMETLCQDLPRGSKILILEAHCGVGALALQLSQCLRRGRDLWVTCQCPMRASEAEAFCKANGASETLRDDPLVILNSLHESSYDAIVDTVGGRRIYDAARRVLHHEGLFVTVVGDELTPPNTKQHWRAGIRSLRRAFVKKDKKAIGYLCPGLDEREDCRDTLDRLTSLAEADLLHPVVKRILPFEQGGEAFGAEEEDPGTVVRILET